MLILDEPANGLDPEGMRWMRGLLRDFADRGGTVLLSSHLLHEVEAIADRLVIIGNGRIVAQGSRDELLAGAGTLVRAGDAAALQRGAAAAGLAATPRSTTAASSSTPSPRRSAAPRSTAPSRSPTSARPRAPGSSSCSSTSPRARPTLRPPTSWRPRDDRRRPPRALAAGRDARPGFARLTLVELRKMTDTRAGFWLQLAVIGLTIAIAGLIVGFGTEQDQTLVKMLQATIQPSANLLPVIGILLVSSEWSQRTAQITFTQVPRRTRVIGAKLLAALVVSIAAFAISVVVALLATAIANPGVPGAWSLPAGLLGQLGLMVAISMIGGVAFGALLLASAPAIVAYYLVPIAAAALFSIHAFAATLAPWIDGSRSFDALTNHVISATEWAHVGTTVAFWIGLPLLLGIWRIRRSELP